MGSSRKLFHTHQNSPVNFNVAQAHSTPTFHSRQLDETFCTLHYKTTFFKGIGKINGDRP
jgi:hypothetical protein